jgi:ribonuclease D
VTIVFYLRILSFLTSDTNVTLITTNAELDAHAHLWQNVAYVTLDTEFVRLRTYFPQLCVLQLGSEHGAIAIDALAPGIDLSPIWELCRNKNIVKCFHAGQQDIEIIFRASGHVPAPLFDTQIAGMALGFGESVSYRALVENKLGIIIDKTHQYTDWTARPISPAKLDYALGDVIHLHTIYPMMMAELEARGRSDWIQEEMAALAVPLVYPPQFSQIWQRFRSLRYSKTILLRLKQLVWFRENYAVTHNLPRAGVITDHALEALAKLDVKATLDEKARASIEKLLKNKPFQAEIVAMFASPPIVPDTGNYKRYQPPAEDVRDTLKRLQALLRKIAEKAEVVPRLVVSKNELEQLVAVTDPSNLPLPCLEGWRHALFGQHALAMLSNNALPCCNQIVVADGDS